jgi:hypothetical protein
MYGLAEECIHQPSLKISSLGARIPAWCRDLWCLLDENKLLCGGCIGVLIRVIL